MSERLKAMRSNPQSDWKIADVESLCREFDMYCMPVSGGGSHYKIGHAKMPTKLTIPFKRPIKAVYIKNLVRFADALSKLT